MKSREAVPENTNNACSVEGDRNGNANNAGEEQHKGKPDSAAFYFGAAAILFCVLALAVFFRQFLRSKFDRIDGDAADNRLLIAILEHWGAVVHGKASFRSPNFFWPTRGVLAYSDALFLLWPPYALARAAGLDMYLAFELELMFLRALGFFSMLWLLRSFFKLSRVTALLGAFLFTISNVYYVADGLGHSQLTTVVFVPLLVCLAWAAWRSNKHGHKWAGYTYSSLFGLLLAGVLFTSFYIGWFAIFAAALIGLGALLIAMFQGRAASFMGALVRNILTNAPCLAIAGIAFSIAMVPFLLTYLPMLRETGGRPFQETLLYTAQPFDILNIGPTNLAWGRLIEALFTHLAKRPMLLSEAETGWPPVTLLFLPACLVVSLLCWYRSHNKPTAFSSQYHLPLALTLAFTVGWFLSIKLHDSSLWWFVAQFVPGGSAIRAPARFNLVLNVLLVIVICLLLNELGRRTKILFWSLALILVAEQINSVPTHRLRRSFEKDILARVSHPLAECFSFFLTEAATPKHSVDATQIDAMLIARQYDVPTINGYSGWMPPGWKLNQPEESDYLQKVRRWVFANGIKAGVCGLDLRDGHWSQWDLSALPYALESLIDFRRNGDASRYEIAGWGDEEDRWTWTVGPDSVLHMTLSEAPESDLALKFKAQAFIVPRRPKFDETLRVNGTDVALWQIADAHVEKEVILPRELVKPNPLRIEFIDRDPKSPAELGYSSDSRKLGLAIEALRIMPVSASKTYTLGKTIDFRWGGDSKIYETEGWGNQEDGGSWTVGPRSILQLTLAKVPDSDLELRLKAHAFIVPRRPSFEETLRINGTDIAQWRISDAQVEKDVAVPQTLTSSCHLRIEFVDHDPKSPADVGFSQDSRKLGLAMETLVLSPSGR